MSSVPATSSQPMHNTSAFGDTGSDIQVAPDWLGATIVIVLSMVASVVMVLMR